VETVPTDLNAQRDLSVALLSVGSAKLRSQNPADAVEAYREALAISRRLTAGSPDNVEWRRDVSVASSNLGDAATVHGDKEAARSAYAESVAVMRGLLEREPSNALWQSDLALLETKSALLSEGEARRKQLNDALAIVEALARDGRLVGPQTQWPDQLRKLLAQSP
jgi:hypothetical protein